MLIAVTVICKLIGIYKRVQIAFNHFDYFYLSDLTAYEVIFFQEKKKENFTSTVLVGGSFSFLGIWMQKAAKFQGLGRI